MGAPPLPRVLVLADFGGRLASMARGLLLPRPSCRRRAAGACGRLADEARFAGGGYARGRAPRHRSMVKVPPWQRSSSAPVPPQGAPGGSVQLGTPRKRPAHWAPSHCLGCSREPSPKPPISPPLTVQAPIGTRWGGSLTLARTPTPTLTLTPISLLTPTLTESETRTGNPESRDKSAQEGLWACSLHAQRLARPRRASVQQLRLSRAESGFVEELN